MKRNVVEKKRTVAKKRSDRRAKPVESGAAKRVRKYLSAKFTRQLVEHMHKAKKATLENEE